MKTRNFGAISAEIHANFQLICARAQVPAAAIPMLPAKLRLLGSGTKTVKGERIRVLTSVVYASPAHELWMVPGETLPQYLSRVGDKIRTLCGNATALCIVSCLGVAAGRMVMRPVENARRWKAALYVGGNSLFFELAQAECAAFARKVARKKGKWVGAVRFDGSTDTGIGARIAKLFPTLRFYDYTKVPARMRAYAAGKYPANYHVTFSFSGSNWALCQEALSLGVNIAAPFAVPSQDEIPDTFQGVTVYNADETDVRFLDPYGIGHTAPAGIAGLTFKTAAKFAQAAENADVFCLDVAQRAGLTGNTNS